MRLSGHTTPYAVLGHPIGHSLSPVMHNASLEALGLDAIYLAFDVAPELLMETLPAMHNMGFGGVNLTVPLKEIAFNGIKHLDDSAKTLGAVNTIEFMKDGTLKGHNTDGTGFLLAIKNDLDCSLNDLSVFVLGGGGAGRAIALTCAMNGCRKVVVADVNLERTTKLISEIQSSFPTVDTCSVNSDSIKTAAQNADLIIQATPIGMHPDDKPLLHADSFHSDQMLFDLVYMYPETEIMKQAAIAGARTANGLGMLMYQGAHAFEIWTGQKADTKSMTAALEREVYQNAK